MKRYLLPEHFQAVFEAMPGAFLLLRPDPDFTIIGASDQYLQATLKRREDVMGRPIFEAFPDNPDTPDAHSTRNVSQSLQRVVEGRRADVMAVQRYDVLRPDGGGFEMRYWSPENAPVFGADGELICIVHRVDNVTDYVQLTEEHAQQRSVAERLSADKIRMEAEIVERSLELDRLNREMRAANAALSRYAEQAAEEAERKDEFLAMLAHELRNPLSAMSTALQLWNIAPAGEQRQQTLLGVFGRQVKNLTRLVDDLLEMSRIDRGAVELQRAPLDLRDVIDSALHATRELFERQRLTLTTRFAPARFQACGDATRLEQALTNLLANAAKFSEPGGNVELRLEPDPSNPCRARIDIRDEGRGIPPDKLEAIFEIFVQVDVSLDRTRGGLGIGLALVRSIVGLHGGSVRAASAGIGHGSTFIVELPLLPAEEQHPEPAATPARATPARRATDVRNVLVVEDNLDARQSLEALLRACGHMVRTAATGDEGLRMIVEEKPDIAIVDIGLPVLDGFEVARRARPAIGQGTRLVALTGYNSPEVRSQALQAGFDLHVAKPCTSEKLAEILGLAS